jgi:hypothetical protein
LIGAGFALFQRRVLSNPNIKALVQKRTVRRQKIHWTYMVKVCPLSLRCPSKQTSRNREEFRALLGVRKYPKNESLVLWAVAMGISAEGLDWWGLLKPGLAGLGATSVYGVVSVST